MRFICGGFYLIFLSLMSGFALGAPVQYETVRVGNGSYAPSGVTTPVTVRFSGPAIQDNSIPSYKQIVPVATKPVIGRLARSLVRGGGVGLAVTAAVEGLGYLIDQATGEIKKIEFVPQPFPSDPTAAVPGGGGSGAACRQGHGLSYQHIHFYEPVASRPTWCGGDGQWLYTAITCKPGAILVYPSSSTVGCVWPEAEPPPPLENIIDLDPSDYEVIDNAIDDFSLSQKSRIVSQALQNSPISGTADTSGYPASVSSSNPQVQQLFDMWPQLQEALSLAVNSTLAELLMLLNPEFQPTPEEQQMINTGIWAPPPETSIPIDFELPAFCQWAEFICRPFLDTEHPEVPELDLEAEDYDSGLPSAGQCPVPILIEFELWGEHEISLQPVCDFAAGVRPFLLAIAYLVSAFIVVGVRR